MLLKKDANTKEERKSTDSVRTSLVNSLKQLYNQCVTIYKANQKLVKIASDCEWNNLKAILNVGRGKEGIDQPSIQFPSKGVKGGNATGGSTMGGISNESSLFDYLNM